MLTLTGKKICVSILLGSILMPSLLFAAQQDNPFGGIVKQAQDESDSSNPPSDGAGDVRPPHNDGSGVPSTPQDPAPVSTPTPTLVPNPAPVTSPTANAQVNGWLSTILADNKDVAGEAQAGQINSKQYQLVSGFAERFNDKLFGGGDNANEVGQKGARNLLVTIARDAKNLFTVLAFTLLVIIILIFFFWSKGEDDAKKVKSAIVNTTLGIMLMQVAYVFINVLFDKNIWPGGGAVGVAFYNAIILPIINLVRFLASFAFLSMAFLAFYQMVTSGGDPKAREKGIGTIIGSILGFVIVKLTEVLVTSVYGKINCGKVVLGRCQSTLLTDPNLSDTIKIFSTIVNYVNGFIGLATLLLIIYAGWNIMFNGEDGMKKGKSMIKWIVVGMGLLVSSYILFKFFILKN